MNLEQILGQAEETFRQSLDTLNNWSDQARDILQNRPGVVLASLSIAGFMTGLLLRRGGPVLDRSKGFTGDPLIVFLTGAFAGFTVGPRILREVAQGTGPSGAVAGGNVTSFDRGGERSGHA